MASALISGIGRSGSSTRDLAPRSDPSSEFKKVGVKSLFRAEDLDAYQSPVLEVQDDLRKVSVIINLDGDRDSARFQILTCQIDVCSVCSVIVCNSERLPPSHRIGLFHVLRELRVR